MKFPEVGSTATIVVDHLSEWESTNDDGKLVTTIVIHGTIDGEERRWFTKPQALYALRQAIKAAGRSGPPEQGSTIDVKRVEDGVAQPGKNAPHGFKARYTPPEPGADAAFATAAPAVNEEPF